MASNAYDWFNQDTGDGGIGNPGPPPTDSGGYDQSRPSDSGIGNAGPPPETSNAYDWFNRDTGGTPDTATPDYSTDTTTKRAAQSIDGGIGNPGPPPADTLPTPAGQDNRSWWERGKDFLGSAVGEAKDLAGIGPQALKDTIDAGNRPWDDPGAFLKDAYASAGGAVANTVKDAFDVGSRIQGSAAIALNDAKAGNWGQLASDVNPASNAYYSITGDQAPWMGDTEYTTRNVVSRNPAAAILPGSGGSGGGHQIIPDSVPIIGGDTQYDIPIFGGLARGEEALRGSITGNARSQGPSLDVGALQQDIANGMPYDQAIEKYKGSVGASILSDLVNPVNFVEVPGVGEAVASIFETKTARALGEIADKAKAAQTWTPELAAEGKQALTDSGGRLGLDMSKPNQVNTITETQAGAISGLNRVSTAQDTAAILADGAAQIARGRPEDALQYATQFADQIGSSPEGIVDTMQRMADGMRYNFEAKGVASPESIARALDEKAQGIRDLGTDAKNVPYRQAAGELGVDLDRLTQQIMSADPAVAQRGLEARQAVAAQAARDIAKSDLRAGWYAEAGYKLPGNENQLTQGMQGLFSIVRGLMLAGSAPPLALQKFTDEWFRALTQGTIGVRASDTAIGQAMARFAEKRNILGQGERAQGFLDRSTVGNLVRNDVLPPSAALRQVNPLTFRGAFTGENRYGEAIRPGERFQALASPVDKWNQSLIAAPTQHVVLNALYQDTRRLSGSAEVAARRVAEAMQGAGYSPQMVQQAYQDALRGKNPGDILNIGQQLPPVVPTSSMAKGTAIPTQRDLEARGKNITPQVRQAIAESGGQPGLLRDLATPPPTPIDYTPKQMTRATNTTENAAAKWANGFDRTSPAADVPAIVPGSPVPANVIQTARRMGIDTPPTKTAGQLADEIAAQRPVGVNRGSAGGGTSQKIPTAAEAAEYQQQVADIAAAKGGGAEPIIPGPRGPTEPSPYGYRGVPGGWQKITAEDLGIVPAEKAAGGLVVSRTAQDIADDMVAEGVTNPATLQHRARANGMAGGVEISDAEAQAALTQAQARAAGGGAPLDIAASNGGAPASSLADGVLAALTPEERAVAEPRLRAMIARYGDQPMTPQEFDARFGTTYRGYGRFGGAPDAAGFVSPNRRGVIYTTPNETIAAGAYGRPLGETGTPAKYSALHYPNDAKIADLNDPATARALLSEMVDRPHPTLGEYRFGRPEQQYMKGEGAFSGMSRERFDAIREEIANALDVSTGGAGQLELMDDPWAVDALRRLGFEGATNGKTTAFLDSSTLLPSWARNAYTEPRAGLPRAGGTPIPNAADLAAAEEEAFSRYQNQAENAAELGPEDELVTPEQQAYLDKQMGKQPGTPIPKAADLAAPARSTLREGNRDGELIRAYAEGRANPDRIIAQAQAQYADAVAMADIPAMQRVEERLLDHGQAAAVAKNTAAYDAYNAARLEMFGPQSATPEGRAAHWQAVQEQLDKTAAMMPGPRPELTKAGGPGPRQVTAAERGAIDRGMYDTATADHTAEYEAWQAREADRLAPYDPNAPSPTDIYGAGPPTEADIARLQANPLSPGRVEIPNISIDPRMRDLIAGRMTDEEAAAIRDRGLYGRAAGQQEAPFYREGVIPSIGREGLPPIGNEGLPLQLPQGDIPLQLPRGPLPRQIETLGPNVTRYSGDLADLAAGGGTMRPPLAGFSTAPETRLLPSGAPIPALHGPDFVPPLGRPFTDFTAGEAGTVRGLPIAPPRDVQALEAARGRAQAGIRDAAFARGTGDQAAVQAGLERGYRIVGNNADQTTAGMWMKNGVGGVTPPVLPFAPFHIHSAQFWSQYFAAHPALALGMAQVLQTFDDYGTLKFPEGNSLAGLIKTTTGLHILDWAQKAYEYATDVNRAGGNNIPQQILKNLNYNLTGNNAFVRPFEYISGPLASLTQRTTNPLLSGKLDYDTKQPLADSRDLLREYGAMNGTTGFGQRLNDLAGSPLPRNVVTGATNPGQALGNLLQRGTDTAFGVNRQEYNPDLAAAHALGFVADQMGLSKYQAERAYYSPQTPQDIALGKQLHDAVNVRLDTQAMGKLAPVQARGAQSAMEAKGIYQPNTEKAYMLDMPIGTGGFTGKDLLNQPGNYYNTLDKITAAKAQYGDNSPQVKALQGELAKIRATDVAQAPGPLGQYFDALHKQDLATYGDQTFRGKLNPQEQNAYDAFNNLKASADYKARTALEQQAAEANKGKDAPKGSAEHNAYTDFYKRNGDELTRLNNIVNGAEQSIVDRFGVNPKELSNRAAVAAGYAPSYADTTIGGQKPIGGVPSTSNNSNANTSNARSTSSNIRASGTSSRTSSRGGTSSSTGGTAAATRQAGNDFFDLYKSVTDKGEKAAVLRAFDKAGITPFDKGTTAQEYRAALTVAQEALRTKRAADLIDAAGSRQRAAGSTQQGGTRALSLAELSQLMERTTGIGPAAADRGMLGGGYSASSATPRTFSLPNPGSATGSTKAPAGYYYDKSGRLQKSKFAA